VVSMPTGADFPAASTLLMNALTARVALDRLAVQAAGTVAVTGAAGAVGGFAVQLAAGEGLRVLADAGSADTQLVTSLGAGEVVARGDDVAERFRDIARNGVDAVLDAAAMNALILPAIRDGGGLAVVRRGWDGPIDRGIQVHRIMVAEWVTDQARLLRLADQAGRGELTLRVADVLPADQAARAHERLAEGGVRGRLVLDFAAF
jgi:NADPH:quinone reductase